jgi:hypothetical protein
MLSKTVVHLIFAVAVLAAAKYVGQMYLREIQKPDVLADARLMLGDNPDRTNLPKLWIHTEYARNAREWASFGSPVTNNLNQDYLKLCAIIMSRRCGDDFDIMLIDDSSFHKLLPDWKHDDISVCVEPRKTRLREIGLAMLVHLYGGMVIPGSFVCARSLRGMYDSMLDRADMFVGVAAKQGTHSAASPVAPIYIRSAHILGARKGAPVLQEYIKELSLGVHNDLARSEYTRSTEISGWLAARADVAETRETGLVDTRGREIIIERLFSDANIDLPEHDYGLLLPGAAILARHKYGWFAQLNAAEILASQVFAARYISAAIYETQYAI